MPLRISLFHTKQFDRWFRVYAEDRADPLMQFEAVESMSYKYDKNNNIMCHSVSEILLLQLLYTFSWIEVTPRESKSEDENQMEFNHITFNRHLSRFSAKNDDQFVSLIAHIVHFIHLFIWQCGATVRDHHLITSHPRSRTVVTFLPLCHPK